MSKEIEYCSRCVHRESAEKCEGCSVGGRPDGFDPQWVIDLSIEIFGKK